MGSESHWIWQISGCVLAAAKWVTMRPPFLDVKRLWTLTLQRPHTTASHWKSDACSHRPSPVAPVKCDAAHIPLFQKHSSVPGMWRKLWHTNNSFAKFNEMEFNDWSFPRDVAWLFHCVKCQDATGKPEDKAAQQSLSNGCLRFPMWRCRWAVKEAISNKRLDERQKVN